MLLGIDGYVLCWCLCEDVWCDILVIMFIVCDQLDDCLQGFCFGVDDYLVKFFVFFEFFVCIEVVLCCVQGGGCCELSVVDFSYDLDILEVKCVGKLFKFNLIGLKLFVVLMQKSFYVVCWDVLEEVVWGDDCLDSDSLCSYVY